MDSFNQYRVLVVEDHPIQRKVLSSLFSQAGNFEVASVDNGQKALGMLETFVPDIILLDRNMPGGISGDDVALTVRANPLMSKCRIIIVSGKSDPEDIRDGFERLGAAGYFTKPAEPSVVLAAVRNVARLMRAERDSLSNAGVLSFLAEEATLALDMRKFIASTVAGDPYVTGIHNLADLVEGSRRLAHALEAAAALAPGAKSAGCDLGEELRLMIDEAEELACHHRLSLEISKIPDFVQSGLGADVWKALIRASLNAIMPGARMGGVSVSLTHDANAATLRLTGGGFGPVSDEGDRWVSLLASLAAASGAAASVSCEDGHIAEISVTVPVSGRLRPEKAGSFSWSVVVSPFESSLGQSHGRPSGSLQLALEAHRSTGTGGALQWGGEKSRLVG